LIQPRVDAVRAQAVRQRQYFRLVLGRIVAVADKDLGRFIQEPGRETYVRFSAIFFSSACIRPRLYIGGDGVRVHAFVDLDSFLGGIGDYPAIRALR